MRFILKDSKSSRTLLLFAVIIGLLSTAYYHVRRRCVSYGWIMHESQHHETALEFSIPSPFPPPIHTESTLSRLHSLCRSIAVHCHSQKKSYLLMVTPSQPPAQPDHLEHPIVSELPREKRRASFLQKLCAFKGKEARKRCVGDGHLECIINGSIAVQLTTQPAGGHSWHHSNFSVFNPSLPATHG